MLIVTISSSLARHEYATFIFLVIAVFRKANHANVKNAMVRDKSNAPGVDQPVSEHSKTLKYYYANLIICAFGFM